MSTKKLAPQRDPADRIILGGRAIRDFLYGEDSDVKVEQVEHQLRSGHIPNFRIGRRRATTPSLLQSMGRPAGEEAA